MSMFRSRLSRVGMTRRSANLLLMLATMFWGMSYVLIKIAGAGMPPMEVMALRFSLAGLICVIVFRHRLHSVSRRTLCYGIILGVTAFVSSTAIIYGTQVTEASTAAFLTSTAIVIVPVAQAVRKRRLPEPVIIGYTVLATIGIALLSLKDGFSLSAGALLCILGAALYAAFIICTDAYAHQEDGILLGVIQLAVMGVLGWVGTLLFAQPTLPGTPSEWAAVLCLALICSAFAFVAQPYAQGFTTPENTALIFSMEPVWGAFYADMLPIE